MRLALIVAGPLAIEEALFARTFLEQLPPGYETIVVCHTASVYYLVEDLTNPETCRWLLCPYNDADDRDTVAAYLRDFDPALLILADPGAVDSPTDRLPSDWLETLNLPIVGLDTGGSRPDLPIHGWLRACPPCQPDDSGVTWQPFGGIEGPLSRYQMREELLRRHQLPEDTAIVLMPFSLQVQVMAGVRLLGAWYPVMIEAVIQHLQALGRPVLLVVVTPGCPLAPEVRGTVTIAPYHELVPNLMTRFVAAADLLLIEQAWRYWRYRALAQGLPVALLSNSVVWHEEEARPWTLFGGLTPEMTALTDKLLKAAPHALFPFNNFPQPIEDWRSDPYDPAQAWARLDVFDTASCHTVLTQLLSVEEQPKWQAAGQTFLTPGRGAPSLAESLRSFLTPVVY